MSSTSDAYPPFNHLPTESDIALPPFNYNPTSGSDGGAPPQTAAVIGVIIGVMAILVFCLCIRKMTKPIFAVFWFCIRKMTKAILVVFWFCIRKMTKAMLIVLWFCIRKMKKGILVVLCLCIRKMKKAAKKKEAARPPILQEGSSPIRPPILQEGSSPTQPPILQEGSSPTSDTFKFQKAGAPEIEKFFLELTQENPVRFTAQQLSTFTSNYFTVLGSGGFGKVYQGQFPNGVKIAVKVLNRDHDRNIEQQFMAEIGTIGRTHHINLVRLYGFCYDSSMSALVYEFMENGSLDKHLFTRAEGQQLQWDKLHNIAVGTAKGIAYLHEECHQRIIHYDIKPGNVLLDGNFAPKVADFGLAKLYDRDDSHVTISGYRGTPGYLAPEIFLKNFPVTYKCDVYSFGILLFELVGRRKNTRSGGDSESLNWFPKDVWEEYEKGELMKLLESCGVEEKDRARSERMAMVALWCVQDLPDQRPPMSAVVKMLDGGVEIVPPPKPFQYLFSFGADAFKPPSGSGYNSTSEGTNSYWYKETTPVMAKYEITVASL